MTETHATDGARQRKDEQAGIPSWVSHLRGVDWQANMRALRVELQEPYNHRWWEGPTLRVQVEWPTVRKWATQTLKDCFVGGSSSLSEAQKTEFLNLFRKKCPTDYKLEWIVFVPQTSNIDEAVEAESEMQEVEAQTEQQSQADTLTKLLADCGIIDLNDDVWSVDAGSVDAREVDALPERRIKVGEEEKEEEQEKSTFDWEPDELKSLDWQANVEALKLELQAAENEEWDTNNTVYVKDASLRLWAKQTLTECLDHRLPERQRKEFLSLFLERKVYLSLGQLVFLNPVTVLASIAGENGDNSPVAEVVGSDDSETDSDSCQL